MPLALNITRRRDTPLNRASSRKTDTTTNLMSVAQLHHTEKSNLRSLGESLADTTVARDAPRLHWIRQSARPLAHPASRFGLRLSSKTPSGEELPHAGKNPDESSPNESGSQPATNRSRWLSPCTASRDCLQKATSLRDSLVHLTGGSYQSDIRRIGSLRVTSVCLNHKAPTGYSCG